MDRLLCGDVGFGKTEVAIRAAFKCVMNGKQCAVLVPTTILAWQHYQTVPAADGGVSRCAWSCSPGSVPPSSRRRLSRISAGARWTLSSAPTGVIQKDVQFKDLGLAIIDEEQRFGVAHKERFKEMFAHAWMC